MTDTVSGPAPRIFTLPPHVRFLEALGADLLDTFGSGEALSDVWVLTPTRRAARALARAIADLAGGAAFLPTIRPIGDVDADDPPFEPGEIALELPPPLSPAQRRFELAALLHAKARAVDPAVDPAAALPLAEELGRLLDEAAGEGGADFTAVTALYDRLPQHLQDAATFLSIVEKAWPNRLAELGRLDAAARRDALIRRLAARWRERPPRHPIIAAGSTGSAPATAELLEVIARAPQGCVLLPGLDQDLDEAAWSAVDEQHPQNNLKRLLDKMGARRSAVRLWPGAAENPAAAGRLRVLNEALRPADATADWPARVAELRLASPSGDPIAAGLNGLSLIEAADEDHEARVVALAMREALEDPKATVMLVTPDRGLAQRVETALLRWDVTAEASAGRPLPETVAGAFLRRVLDVAGDPGDPLALAALLSHTACALGRSENAIRAEAAALECVALRGVRAGDGWSAIAQRLRDRPDADVARYEAPRSALLRLVEDLRAAFAPFEPLHHGAASLAAFAEAHARTAEILAASPEQTGAARVWVGPDGEAAAGLMRELLTEADAFPALTLSGYARAFDRLAETKAVRPPPSPGARARILGPLEARLQSADLVVLGGLNEGAWPGPAPQDPFLSAGMRDAAGLPPVERKFGLAAHDFAQLAGAPRVLLTRAERAEGAPAVASRWLWRLKTLAQGAGVSISTTSPTGCDLAALAAELDRPLEPAPALEPPAPRPPVEARPRRLSVTRIRDWIRDPYALYAREVLRLRPLEPLGRPADARERGNALHEALAETLHAAGDPLPGDFEERLRSDAFEAYRRFGLDPAALAREAPRIARAAAWFAAQERSRRAEGWLPVAYEVSGAMTLDAPAGPFLLTAKADRLDAGPSGHAVLDYKTGEPPSAKEARQFDPQLALEAAILAADGFPDIAGARPVSLLYVRVKGGPKPGDVRALETEDADAGALAEEAVARLAGLVARFDDPATAYRSQRLPKFAEQAGDYDRLARRKEWARAGAEEDAA